MLNLLLIYLLQVKCSCSLDIHFITLFLWRIPKDSPVLPGSLSKNVEAKIWYFWCTDASQTVNTEEELTFQAAFIYHKGAKINR